MELWVLLLCVPLAYADTTSYACRECLEAYVTSDNTFFQQMIQQDFDRRNDPDCKNKAQNAHNVTSLMCYSQCITIDAEFQQSVPISGDELIPIELKMFLRACAEDYEFEPITDGCYDADEHLTAIMGEGTEVHKARGRYCACTGDNCNQDQLA